MAFRPGEATLKEDWVWKQNRLGRWQKRWLRLTDQRIIYWHNKPPGAIEAGATVDRYAEELAKILDDGDDVSSWGQSNDGKRRSEVAAQKKKDEEDANPPTEQDILTMISVKPTKDRIFSIRFASSLASVKRKLDDAAADSIDGKEINAEINTTNSGNTIAVVWRATDDLEQATWAAEMWRVHQAAVKAYHSAAIKRIQQDRFDDVTWATMRFKTLAFFDSGEGVRAHLNFTMDNDFQTAVNSTGTSDENLLPPEAILNNACDILRYIQLRGMSEKALRFAKLDCTLRGAVAVARGFLDAARDAGLEHQNLAAAAELADSIEGDPTVRREAETFLSKCMDQHSRSMTSRLVLELAQDDAIEEYLCSLKKGNISSLRRATHDSPVKFAASIWATDNQMPWLSSVVSACALEKRAPPARKSSIIARSIADSSKYPFMTGANYAANLSAPTWAWKRTTLLEVEAECTISKAKGMLAKATATQFIPLPISIAARMLALQLNLQASERWLESSGILLDLEPSNELFATFKQDWGAETLVMSIENSHHDQAVMACDHFLRFHLHRLEPGPIRGTNTAESSALQYIAPDSELTSIPRLDGPLRLVDSHAVTLEKTVCLSNSLGISSDIENSLCSHSGTPFDVNNICRNLVNLTIDEVIIRVIDGGLRKIVLPIFNAHIRRATAVRCGITKASSNFKANNTDLQRAIATLPKDGGFSKFVTGGFGGAAPESVLLSSLEQIMQQSGDLLEVATCEPARSAIWVRLASSSAAIKKLQNSLSSLIEDCAVVIAERTLEAHCLLGRTTLEASWDSKERVMDIEEPYLDPHWGTKEAFQSISWLQGDTIKCVLAAANSAVKYLSKRRPYDKRSGGDPWPCCTAALASAVLLKYAEAFFSLSTPEPDAEADSPLPMGGTTPLQNYVESNVQVSSGSTTTRQWFGRRSRTNITMQSGSSISASSSSSLSSGTCIWELRPDAISRILSDIADMKMWVIDIEDELPPLRSSATSFTTGGTDQQSSTGNSCLDALITRHAQSLHAAQRLLHWITLWLTMDIEALSTAEECNETLADGLLREYVASVYEHGISTAPALYDIFRHCLMIRPTKPASDEQPQILFSLSEETRRCSLNLASAALRQFKPVAAFTRRPDGSAIWSDEGTDNSAMFQVLSVLCPNAVSENQSQLRHLNGALWTLSGNGSKETNQRALDKMRALISDMDELIELSTDRKIRMEQEHNNEATEKYGEKEKIPMKTTVLGEEISKHKIEEDNYIQAPCSSDIQNDEEDHQVGTEISVDDAASVVSAMGATNKVAELLGKNGPKSDAEDAGVTAMKTGNADKRRPRGFWADRTTEPENVVGDSNFSSTRSGSDKKPVPASNKEAPQSTEKKRRPRGLWGAKEDTEANCLEEEEEVEFSKTENIRKSAVIGGPKSNPFASEKIGNPFSSKKLGATAASKKERKVASAKSKMARNPFSSSQGLQKQTKNSNPFSNAQLEHQ